MVQIVDHIKTTKCLQKVVFEMRFSQTQKASQNCLINQKVILIRLFNLEAISSNEVINFVQNVLIWKFNFLFG